jgi:hypothetical protein
MYGITSTNGGGRDGADAVPVIITRVLFPKKQKNNSSGDRVDGREKKIIGDIKWL